MNINSIYFCESVGNKTFNLGNASEFNSEIEGWPVVKIKTFLDFNNDLKVFYPESQELSLFSESENYKAFIGDADYIALTNGLWKPQVIYEFDKINNYILVFYKANFKLLIIVIHSDGLIEKKDLNLLKLR